MDPSLTVISESGFWANWPGKKALGQLGLGIRCLDALTNGALAQDRPGLYLVATDLLEDPGVRAALHNIREVVRLTGTGLEGCNYR